MSCFDDSRRNCGRWTLTSPPLQLYWHQSKISKIISKFAISLFTPSIHLASISTVVCHCCWKDQGDQHKGQHTLKHLFENLYTVPGWQSQTFKMKGIFASRLYFWSMDLTTSTILARSPKHSPWPLSWSQMQCPMTSGCECWQFQNNRISDSASQKSPGVPYAQNSRPKSSPCNGNVRHNTRNILRKEIPVKILLMLEGLIWLSIFFHLDRTSISYVYRCNANDRLNESGKFPTTENWDNFPVGERGGRRRFIQMFWFYHWMT